MTIINWKPLFSCFRLKPQLPCFLTNSDKYIERGMIRLFFASTKVAKVIEDEYKQQNWKITYVDEFVKRYPRLSPVRGHVADVGRFVDVLSSLGEEQTTL